MVLNKDLKASIHKLVVMQNLFLFLLTDLPPPPPEAYNEPEEDADKQVQSRTFKMLQDAVEGGGWYDIFSV